MPKPQTPSNTRKVQSTGTTVTLWRPGEQCEKEDGWMLICEDHGGVLNGHNCTDLRSWWSHPEEWCPTCQTKRNNIGV